MCQWTNLCIKWLRSICVTFLLCKNSQIIYRLFFRNVYKLLSAEYNCRATSRPFLPLTMGNIMRITFKLEEVTCHACPFPLEECLRGKFPWRDTTYILASVRHRAHTIFKALNDDSSTVVQKIMLSFVSVFDLIFWQVKVWRIHLFAEERTVSVIFALPFFCKRMHSFLNIFESKKEIGPRHILSTSPLRNFCVQEITHEKFLKCSEKLHYILDFHPKLLRAHCPLQIRPDFDFKGFEKILC